MSKEDLQKLHDEIENEEAQEEAREGELATAEEISEDRAKFEAALPAAEKIIGGFFVGLDKFFPDAKLAESEEAEQLYLEGVTKTADVLKKYDLEGAKGNWLYDTWQEWKEELKLAAFAGGTLYGVYQADKEAKAAKAAEKATQEGTAEGAQ